VKLCAQERVTLINVVRRDEQAEVLKALGAEHIVVSNTENWKEDLAALVKEHSITCAFDAISGENVGDIVSAMPKKSTTFVYGGLSGEPIGGIPTMDMIYFGKKVEGWLLPTYLQGASGGSMGMLMRINGMSKIVNAGLKPGGWASSQFVDVAPDEMWGKFLAMRNGQVTNQKLRIRFPQCPTDCCLRDPSDGKNGSSCCPKCKESNGAEHDEECTKKFMLKAPVAEEPRPSAAEASVPATSPAAAAETPAAETPAAATPAAETPAAAAGTSSTTSSPMKNFSSKILGLFKKAQPQLPRRL